MEFTCSGPVIWRGGYNGGLVESNSQFIERTELGISRMSIRSTLSLRSISVTASHPGLESAKLQIGGKRGGVEA